MDVWVRNIDHDHHNHHLQSTHNLHPVLSIGKSFELLYDEAKGAAPVRVCKMAMAANFTINRAFSEGLMASQPVAGYTHVHYHQGRARVLAY